jgi:hypothetical protein
MLSKKSIKNIRWGIFILIILNLLYIGLGKINFDEDPCMISAWNYLIVGDTIEYGGGCEHPSFSKVFADVDSFKENGLYRRFREDAVDHLYAKDKYSYFFEGNRVFKSSVPEYIKKELEERPLFKDVIFERKKVFLEENKDSSIIKSGIDIENAYEYNRYFSDNNFIYDKQPYEEKYYTVGEGGIDTENKILLITLFMFFLILISEKKIVFQKKEK